MQASSFLAFGLVTLFACARDSPRPSEQSPTRATPTLAIDASVIPDASVTVDAAIAIDAAIVDNATPSPRVDVAAWLTDHDITQKFSDRDCTEATVGTPPAPGLICGTRGRVTVYRVEGHRARAVWKNVDISGWLELHLVTQDDGATLNVSIPPGQCESAMCESFEKLQSNVQPPNWDKGIRRTCAARGTYAWRRDTYVRVGSPLATHAACSHGLVQPE